MTALPPGSALAPPFLGLPPGTQIPTDAVPTSVVRGRDGAYYISQLTGFPFEKGDANIWRVVPGQATDGVCLRAHQPHGPGVRPRTARCTPSRSRATACSAHPGELPMGSLVKITPGASQHETVAGDLPHPTVWRSPRTPPTSRRARCARAVARSSRSRSTEPARRGDRLSAGRIWGEIRRGIVRGAGTRFWAGFVSVGGLRHRFRGRWPESVTQNRAPAVSVTASAVDRGFGDAKPPAGVDAGHRRRRRRRRRAVPSVGPAARLDDAIMVWVVARVAVDVCGRTLTARYRSCPGAARVPAIAGHARPPPQPDSAAVAVEAALDDPPKPEENHPDVRAQPRETTVLTVPESTATLTRVST